MQQHARQNDNSSRANVIGEARAQVHERRLQNVGDADVKIAARGGAGHGQGLGGIGKGLGQVHLEAVLDVVELCV